jgi:hypothetical protein
VILIRRSAHQYTRDQTVLNGPDDLSGRCKRLEVVDLEREDEYAGHGLIAATERSDDVECIAPLERRENRRHVCIEEGVELGRRWLRRILAKVPTRAPRHHANLTLTNGCSRKTATRKESGVRLRRARNQVLLAHERQDAEQTDDIGAIALIVRDARDGRLPWRRSGRPRLGRPVTASPRRADECLCLFDPERFGAVIRDWLATSPYGAKPELRVDATDAGADAMKTALELAGIKYVDDPGWTVFASIPADRQAPEFAIGRASIPDRLRRGIAGEALVALREGPNPVHLPVPVGFPANAGWRGPVSVELSGLPLTFPITDPLARACWNEAQKVDAHLVTRLIHVRDVIRTELRLPPPDLQLARHMSSVSLRAEPSGAGKLASTLLDRIAGKDDLDALALPYSLSILDGLVAPSRLKLVQRLASELHSSGVAQINEERVVGLLRREGLFAELAMKTLAQLQGTLQVAPTLFLSSLGRLCEAGYL